LVEFANDGISDIDALAGAGSDPRQSRGNRDMRVAIAANHGGFGLKEELLERSFRPALAS
jgi:hypothetical protein